MSKYVVLRLLDSFFRHKLLHILPLVAFTALGVWYVVTQDVEYQAKGVLLVEDETLLTSLTQVGGDSSGFQTPADRVSSELNSLLQTDAFVTDVASNAGIGSDLARERIERIQASIGAFAVGENLVHIWSNDIDPERARAKAAATIENLIQFHIDSEVGDSAAAEGVLDPLTEQYRDDLAVARQALTDYLVAHPIGEGETRPSDEQFRVDQLTAALTKADTRYSDALAKEESARLAKTQAESAIENRFQIVDEPKLPTSPLGRLRTRALMLAVFLLVGGIMTAASIVLGAALDQSVRYPLDVTTRMGVKVLGVIPDTSSWERPSRRDDDGNTFADRRAATT